MFGDIILWLKTFFSQQTCIHDYKPVYRRDTGGGFDICRKCKKIQ